MSSAVASTTVYGGDEINAVVLDFGSSTTRIGFAGDDFPRIIVPSWYAQDEDGKVLFGTSLDFPKANREIKPIVSDGIVEDWEAMVAQLRYYFDEVLKLDYHEQPILVTEPVWADQPYRQKLVETIYEEFEFPALFLAKQPTCVSFQQGRLTCLVVDIGHDCASVVPIVDGICLLKNSVKTNYSGQFLSDHVQDLIQTKFPDADLTPSYKIRDKTAVAYPEAARYTPRVLDQVTESFDKYQRQKIFADFKEVMLEAPQKAMKTSNAQQAAKVKELYEDESNTRSLELPSGQSIELTEERFGLVDALFDPIAYAFEDKTLEEKYPADNGELSISSPYDDYRPIKRAKKADASQSTPASTPETTTSTKTVRGLTQLIVHAISSVDIDLRTAVANNIIVTGGTSLIPQLTDRLNTELLNANPGLKIRIHAIGNSNERTNQTWIGGSVLASLGTFHQMWVSKAEYEEVGVERIFTQRFR